MNLVKEGMIIEFGFTLKDKDGSEKINATQEAHQRRLKHGSRIDYNWYDLKWNSAYIDTISLPRYNS